MDVTTPPDTFNISPFIPSHKCRVCGEDYDAIDGSVGVGTE